MLRNDTFACGFLLVIISLLNIHFLNNGQLKLPPYKNLSTSPVTLIGEQQRSQTSAQKTKRESFEDIMKALTKTSLYMDMPQKNRPFKHEYANMMPRHGKSARMWSAEWRPAKDSFRYFQPVDDRDLWVYSAFYDDDAMVAYQGKRSVRIIGLAERTSNVLNIKCILHMEDGQRHNSKGWMTYLQSAFKTRVEAIFLHCPHRAKLPPIAVSVSTTGLNKSTNFLEVLHPQHRQRNFTVCHAALHSYFDKAFQLIQSIELNKILGAEHFMIYNISVSTKIDQILRHYERKGELTVIQWHLPTLEPWYVGQLAAINDCIYRNRIESKYVVVVDTDEIIFPHKADSWADMMNNLENGHGWLKNPQYDQHNCNVPRDKLSQTPTNLSKPKALVDSYIFRSAYFDPLASTSSKESLNVSTMDKKLTSKYRLSALKNLQRQHDVFGHNKRSKYITRPDYLDAHGGVHFAYRRTNKIIPAYVKCEYALVHHYRRFGGSTKVARDYTALRYKDALLRNVQRVFKDLHW